MTALQAAPNIHHTAVLLRRSVSVRDDRQGQDARRATPDRAAQAHAARSQVAHRQARGRPAVVAVRRSAGRRDDQLPDGAGDVPAAHRLAARGRTGGRACARPPRGRPARGCRRSRPAAAGRRSRRGSPGTAQAACARVTTRKKRPRTTPPRGGAGTRRRAPLRRPRCCRRPDLATVDESRAVRARRCATDRLVGGGELPAPDRGAQAPTRCSCSVAVAGAVRRRRDERAAACTWGKSRYGDARQSEDHEEEVEAVGDEPEHPRLPSLDVR